MSGDYNEHRVRCSEAAKPVMASLALSERATVECYANAEFWAGWNAAIIHAARVAEGRHRCWQESTIGNSAPCDDISACEDIAAAIRHDTHPKPCASRPLAIGAAS